MARYSNRQDSQSTKTLLIAAGVLVGVLAGAAAAQRLGGWRGISRRLRRGRGPLFDLLRENVSPELISRLLEAGDGMRDLFADKPERLRRKRARGYDASLDEYEVEDYERAAAGLADDDDDLDDGDDVDASPLDEGAEIERDVLNRLQRNRALSQRPIEISCDDDGVVELTGTVHSEREVEMARRLALDVDGVSRVALRLEVREPQAS